jgi:hypothetical protein
VWFPGAEKHVEDERIDQTAYREAVQNLHDSGLTSPLLLLAPSTDT